MSRNRDLGIRGSGKGDNDRTTDLKTYQKNLSEIPLTPNDKTGFTKVGPGRYRKTFGKAAIDKVRSIALRASWRGSNAGCSDH